MLFGEGGAVNEIMIITTAPFKVEEDDKGSSTPLATEYQFP